MSLDTLDVDNDGLSTVSAGAAIISKPASKDPTWMDSVGYMAHGAMAIGSAYLSYQQSKEAAASRASSYRIQQIQAKTMEYQAKVQAKADIMQLQTQFNRVMANNAVMAAAQGRRGGSVEQIAKAAEAKFNWDKDFTKLSSEIQSGGYKAQAEQYALAANTASTGKDVAFSKMMMDVGTSLYSIGD